jgi:hypothetical protein
MVQIHKNFTDEGVKDLMKKYMDGRIKAEHMQKILGIKRRRFFKLLKEYRNNPDGFSIQYHRKPFKTITMETENNIIKELTIEKQLIDDKNVPIRYYNYSYLKDLIFNKYKQKISLPTIIDRAKKNDFYIPRKDKKNIHTREVLTNYAGELIQHDSSYHLFAPYSGKKWYLITSLDDYTRYLLYAILLERETSWAHIIALQSVFMRFGMPLRYYVDCHSIFRFVRGRDSVWQEHRKITDDVVPQWRQVLNDCNVDVTFALSAQAKGKIERPYQWLQDRLVRTCVRENIKDIEPAGEILRREFDRYNNHQVHSTTGEIPAIRLKKAIKDGKSLFREFSIKPPYKTIKDIFCLRDERTVGSYRRISFNNTEISIIGAPISDKVELRMVPNEKTGITEVRLWHKNILIGTTKLKNSVLDTVHF